MTETPQDQPITHNTYNHTYIIDQVGNLNARDVINQGDQVGVQTQTRTNQGKVDQSRDLSREEVHKKSNTRAKSLNVYICYASQDEKYREELERSCLSRLTGSGAIRPWYQGLILAGSDRRKEMSLQLATSHLFLALISSDFSHCYWNEEEDIFYQANVAMERHKSEEAIVVPIIVQPVYGWQEMFHDNIEPLPKGGNAIGLDESRQKSLCKIAIEIQKIVEDFAHKLS